MAGGEREEEDGDKLHEGHESDAIVRAGAGVDFMADRSGLHLHAEDGDEAAGEEAAVVAKTEGGVGVVRRGGGLHGDEKTFREPDFQSCE